MKHKHAIYPLIMSICAFICFLIVLILFSTTVQPLWGRMLLLVLPALILGTIALCAEKGKMGATATNIWTTVLAIVLFLGSVFYAAILFVWTATTTTTDPQYYSRAYRQIREEAGVNTVFPEAIPADAGDIGFTYYPQFLQGGEVFELSYTTTDEKLAQWTEILEKESEWIGSNQEWHAEHNWSFSGDMAAVRYQLAQGGDFNHGKICYVLLNEESGRITFYYSQW